MKKIKYNKIEKKTFSIKNITKTQLIIINIILIILLTIISSLYYNSLKENKEIKERIQTTLLTKEIIKSYYLLFQKMRDLVNKQRFYRESNKHQNNFNLKEKKGIAICSIAKK